MSSSSSTPSSVALTTPPDIDMGAMPIVTLDTADIDHAMAARLTMALLGHMLYMKGQVPFPVQSIARMTQHEAVETTVRSRTTTRTAKKRADFLQSYDDLTSHLHTTFVAVSTALALNETRHRPMPLSVSSSSTHPPAKVYVFLMLGPSPSSAKTRLLLELDGMRVERFGESVFLSREREDIEKCGSGEEDRASDGSFEDGEAHTNAADSDSKDVPAPSFSLPPDSRSSMLARNVVTPPPPICTPSSSPTSSSHSFRTESPPPSSFSVDSSFDTEEFTDPHARHTIVTNTLALEHHAEEAAIRAGERLLSRALFAAGEALGFGDEITPTQAHIFIRAPRRLAHPTWIPRESLGSSLDRHVQRFLATELHQARAGGVPGKSAFGAGVRTVGVQVTCRRGGPSPHDAVETHETNRPGGGNSGEDDGDDDERDELIWWSWDGKLIGFAD